MVINELVFIHDWHFLNEFKMVHVDNILIDLC
jgi:hypothetical protein